MPKKSGIIATQKTKIYEANQVRKKRNYFYRKNKKRLKIRIYIEINFINKKHRMNYKDSKRIPKSFNSLIR